MQIKNQRFKITSVDSSNREIFICDEMEDPEIDEIVTTSINNEETYVLKGKGRVYCTLRWEGEVLRGRDVRGGYTVLRPIEEISEQRSLPEVGQRDREVNTALQNRRVLPVSEYQDQVNEMVDNVPKGKSQAIAIMGCDRPRYLKQVLEGLSKSNLEDYDVYLFLDKPKDRHAHPTTQEQIDLGFTENVIPLPVNYGCGRAIIEMRKQIFDRKGYQKAFIFEDDMVPGTNYIQFCENLLQWGLENYSNVGAVQGWTKCLMTPDDKKSKTSHVHATYTNWWGYLTTKEAWDSAKEFIYEYNDRFLLGDYATRPVTSILQFFKGSSQRKFGLLPGGFQPNDQSLTHRSRLFQSIPSGQDGATWLGYDQANLVRLAPVVNRGIYIGKTGIHSNPQIYAKQGFDRMSLETYPQDSRRKNFKV